MVSPSNNVNTENRTFATKTQSTSPKTIKHTRSAILKINQAKQELEIIKKINNQMKITPHAVLQLNNNTPYEYQVTFQYERELIQALTQKLTHDNKTYKLESLAATRIPMSIMRVDPELDNKDVDLALVKYGKITENTIKLMKKFPFGPVHL